MLDDRAIHVCNVECPIRAVREVDRAEPFVLCGEEFDTLTTRIVRRTSLRSESVHRDE